MATQEIKNKIEELKTAPRNTNSKLKGKRLTRHLWNVHNLGIVNDSIFSLDNYYIGLINDTLHNIRTNHSAWVFNIDQLKDILRFEPEVDFRYCDEDCVIYIWR